MKKMIIIIAMLGLILAGCQTQVKDNTQSDLSDNRQDTQSSNHASNQGTGQESIDNIDDENELVTATTLDTEKELSQELQALKDNQAVILKASDADGVFLETTKQVKERLLSLLLNPTKTNNDSYSMIEPTLILKADGYAPIYINLDNQNFWFEGANESYEVDGLNALWSRYVIKQVSGDYVYDHFEKNVLTQFKADLDEDGRDDHIVLYDDSATWLKVNDEQIQLSPRGMEQSLVERASLDYLKDLHLLVYSYEGMSVHGSYDWKRFYQYKDNQMREVVYSDQVLLKDIRLDEGYYELEFMPSHLTYRVNMTEEEIKESLSRQQEIEGDMDSATRQQYENDLVTALVIETKEALIQNKEEDQTELLVSGRLQMKFGSSYLYIDEPIQLTYQIESNHIDLKQVVLKEGE